MTLIWWTFGTLGGSLLLYMAAYFLSRWREPYDKTGAAAAWGWAGLFCRAHARLWIAWVMIWALIGLRSVLGVE